MTGQYTLLSLLLTRDLSWAIWGPELTVVIHTSAAKTALHINSAQLTAYLLQLTTHGYVSVVDKGRGWIKLKILELAPGLRKRCPV